MKKKLGIGGRLPYAEILVMCMEAARASKSFRVRAIDTLIYADSSKYTRAIIERKLTLKNRPSVFVIAGFHGEEPAGPIAIAHGISKWIAFAEKHKLNLSVVPCANPWGYDQDTRYPPKARFTNGGFAHKERVDKQFSALKKLLEVSHINYYIDLHEDDTDPKGIYTYAFGDTSIAKRVLAAMTSKEIPLDPMPTTDDPEVEKHIIGEGLVYEEHDGSSEDMVSHKPENIVALAPETPSLTFPLAARVAAHERGVTELLKIAAQSKTRA